MADKERKQDVQVNLAPGFGPKYERVKPPKDIKDVPRYLKELLGGLKSLKTPTGKRETVPFRFFRRCL